MKFTHDTAHSLLEHLTTAILVLDTQLCVLYANSAAEQLFALGRAQLVGQNISQFNWQEDANLDALRSALADKCSYTRREVRLYFPYSEHIITLDYTATPNAQGDQILLELIPQDRLLRLNREGSLLNTNQATQALVYGMAHEVRNPLGGIRGAAQLLARELTDLSLHEYTDVIISEVDRLSHLVERMLGSHKMLNLQTINVHQVLERVYWVLKAEVGDSIQLMRDYDPSLPVVSADLDQLIQVMLNIARNAAQALQENPCDHAPRIIFRTRVLRQFTIGTTYYRMVCLIEIEDNGPGIHQELQEMLFYPMVTGRAQGAGLGLPIAQAIMQQHKGLIECVSQPKSTVFRILIPFQHSIRQEE